MKKNLLKTVAISALVTTGFAATSCSRSDDNNGNKVKVTLSIPNAEDADFISLAVAAGNTNGTITNWKINGQVQNGQQGVGLGDTEFLGATKTYVIESTEDVNTTSISVQLINYDNPMNYTFKIEKGGTVVANETNKTLTGNGTNFTKIYSF